MNYKGLEIRSILFMCILVFLTGTAGSGFSQIVVDQGDMPQPGDTLRVSTTNLVAPGYEMTGMDTAWDFTALTAMVQRVDTFVSAASTPSAYQLFFVVLGGANLASPLNTSIIPGLPFSQAYSFFKNNAASYGNLGSAYTVQGIPLPIKYDIPDKYYEFPMHPGSAWSSGSSFSISLPSYGYYQTQRLRNSEVDGWGTLTTPFGIFQTLRIKSVLQIHDSIYIDSLGTGFPVNRNITEYKWMAKANGIPVLQINEEAGVATASYRDIFRMPVQSLSVSLGPDTTVLKGNSLTLHVSISGGTPPYQAIWNTLDTGMSLTITVEDTRTYSVFVVDAVQNFGTAQKVVTVRYSQGIDRPDKKEIRVFPDPSGGNISVKIPDLTRPVLMRVVTSRGLPVKEIMIQHPDCTSGFDFSDLTDGLYFLQISLEGKTRVGKFMIRK